MPLKPPVNAFVEGIVDEVLREFARAAVAGIELIDLTLDAHAAAPNDARERSEEHTSELQSRQYLVCRLLLEKKKKNKVRRNLSGSARTAEHSLLMGGSNSRNFRRDLKHLQPALALQGKRRGISHP